MTFTTKHPILLPKNHPVTSTIIKHFHLISLHAGPEFVLSLIRNKFWIPDGRSAVKKEIRKCIRCVRLSAQPMKQMMGDLPQSRISSSRPFEQKGIDFAGPINTKCAHKRKSSIFKSYICLFVCMCTKAVHIEVVSDLTTESFLGTFKRFISRRGYPRDIYSDNGKTFVGAAAHLKTIFAKLKDESLQNFCAQRQIMWHFIPPYAPNFGGLWESSIKLAKRHLLKVTQGTLLTFEALTTLMCQIEACINSRPLVPLSTDPNDVSALTPGHFLIGCPLISLPEILNNNPKSCSFLSRWKEISRARATFWRMWMQSYLHTLNQRRRWQRGQQPLKIGQLVLQKPSSPLPGQWNLARITDVHPGKDGIIRVVSLKTPEGIRQRSVHQIALLPEVISGPPGVYGE